MSRREILRLGLATAALSLLPRNAAAYLTTSLVLKKGLFLYHVHTGESLRITYWKNGEYIPAALSAINYLFRDTRTGKVKDIDTQLLDLLFDLNRELRSDDPFCIVSGYRTPRSNAFLRKTTKGVARNSLHMYGKAADIRLPGFNLWSVRSTAMDLGRGGVGYYPHSQFVHLDVGAIRYWTE